MTIYYCSTLPSCFIYSIIQSFLSLFYHDCYSLIPSCFIYFIIQPFFRLFHHDSYRLTTSYFIYSIIQSFFLLFYLIINPSSLRLFYSNYDSFTFRIYPFYYPITHAFALLWPFYYSFAFSSLLFWLSCSHLFLRFTVAIFQLPFSFTLLW
jgi:hypothetical protein